MSWYRRTKLVFDSLRCNIDPKILPRSHVSSRINPTGFSSVLEKTNRVTYNPFLSQPKRSYYVDRHQVSHFKQRGPRMWIQNRKIVLGVVLVGSVAFIVFWNLEKVPYTKRTHFVLWSKSKEKRIGETEFEQVKKNFEGKVLPETHPESIRVRLIAKEIIDALERGLGYGSMDSCTNGSETGVKEVGMALSEGAGGEETMRWSKDDKRIQIQESKKKDTKAATNHLEGVNWEVIVVNDPMVLAFCLPAGKIVVFTGLLDHFKSDAEVATLIAHEVAHVVARHGAEKTTKNLWFIILQLFLIPFVTPALVTKMSTFFLTLPFSRKTEIEADYIGLLLLASAGYDPRVAPKVYEKQGHEEDVALGEYIFTHPSGKKRSKLLSQANVMEEALIIYREVQAGRGTEGCL